MFGRVIVALWVTLLVPASAMAAGEDCPAADGRAIEKLLADAPSCDRSMDLFRICAYGASGDVNLGSIVREKCEADFLNKLSKTERRRYSRWIRVCERRYARETGTVYRSFEAFCAAGVAQAYSRRAKTVGFKPKRKRQQ
jgi:hypothetical protein